MVEVVFLLLLDQPNIRQNILAQQKDNCRKIVSRPTLDHLGMRSVDFSNNQRMRLSHNNSNDCSHHQLANILLADILATIVDARIESQNGK